MTEEVKGKLLQVYREALGPIAEVYDVFAEYYGEERIDLSCMSFDGLLKYLSERTLGNMGITSYHTDYYDIDEKDYEANGRGKNFLDYIPDLGIIDYCKDTIIRLVRDTFITYDHTKGVAILVRWPKVRVTNEYDKFVDITELYAQVCVSPEGKIIRRFYLSRTEYNIIQWAGGYVHSHVPSFCPTDGAPGFGRPCTGSGPINRTIETLSSVYDLDIWGLFVYELDKYVGVESIAGTPYYRLENIGKGKVLNNADFMKPQDSISGYGGYSGLAISASKVYEFIRYFLNKKCMKFCYRNGSYGLGESFMEFWLKVSNSFIDWYNIQFKKGYLTASLKRLIAIGIIKKYMIVGNSIYTQDATLRLNSATQFEGTDMFKFKGTMLKLHITGVQDFDDSNLSHLIDPSICRVILTRVLRLVNALYGREQTTGETRGEETSPNEKFYVI